jgi:hypothetical protein
MDEPSITVEKQANGTWKVYNVPIVETGIEYPLSTGPHTFTEDELVDAALAYEDVAIRAPRHKLGHSSEYNAVLIGDAEPAFGTWENLRVGDRGQTLYADLEGCPEWLASIIPMAFPSRSVEASPDVETVTGHHYSMVITAVSALGVYWPGCTVLEDLPKWYGADVPEGVEFDPETAEAIAATGGGMARRRNKDQLGLDAAVDTSQIRRKFYSEVDWSWWIRAEKFGDAEGMYIIVDDEATGDLLRVNVSVDGADISFSEPVKVIEEHVPVAAGLAESIRSLPAMRAAIVTGMASSDPKLVIYASRDETAPESNEGGGMDEATRKALAVKVGLDPETATEQQVLDAVNTALPAPAVPEPVVIQPQGDQNDGGKTGPQGGEQPSAYPPVGTGPATPAPDDPKPGEGTDGTEQFDASREVKLDKATYDRLVAGANAGLTLAANESQKAIDGKIKEVKASGQIPPASEAYWRQRLAEDFKGAAATLDAMPKGMIPVELRGSAGNEDGDGSANGNSNAVGLPDDWFPDAVAARARFGNQQAVAAGGSVLNAKEG